MPIVTSRYRTTEAISMRDSLSENEQGYNDERSEQRDQAGGQDVIAPCVLVSEPLERRADRPEAVLGERTVHEARQLRQQRRPDRRLAADRLEQPAPAQLLAHP